MSEIEVPGWRIDAERHYTFVRTFVAYPIEQVDEEFKTNEIRKGQLIPATYDARVSHVRIHHTWDTDKKVWWSSASHYIELLNPRTGEGYLSGWRAGSVSENFSLTHEKKKNPSYIRLLAEATLPRTVITVIEEPA